MLNIDKALVRNEYKLPSKGFLLTVHTLTQPIDTLTDKAIKRWSGTPQSATNVILYLEEGMNIRSISKLYMDTHTIERL